MKAHFRGSETGYDIDKGWTYTKNANETLDSAVIRISHVGKLDIQPFDNVEIKKKTSSNPDTYETYVYLCVDSYQEQQISLDPVIYNYEIHLFSETKKLENIILPNLSITPRKLSTPLTIKGFLNQVWSIYAPRYRGETFKYTFDFNNLPDKFNRVCPEMQWSTPTLRDVLNDLFMLCDCVVTMSNNTIGYLDITSKRNPITNFNFITRSRSSQDYASEIKMNLQNVMQEDYTVTTYKYQTFTTDSFILTTDNLMLETQYPILNVRHLWVNWLIADPFGTWEPDISFINSKPIYIRIDLCNLSLQDDGNNTYSIVKEKRLYDVLPVSKLVNFGNFGTTTAQQYANCKNTCLYYTRGDNKIYGFSNVNKVSLMQTQQLMKLILRLAEYSYLKEHNMLSSLLTDAQLSTAVYDSNNLATWSYPTFEIEYETTKEVVFSAGKKELLRNERTIMDNQTNAWVNAEAQGNLEYQKANRIGNEVVMINQRVTDIQAPIDIFDYMGNEIVYRTEYQIYDDYIDVNAYATKDYILKDYFTGINSKVRTWVNAQEEAFIRHDLFKLYVEFDETNQYNDTSIWDDYSVFSSNIKISTVISAFKPQYAEPINYCLVRCDNNPDANRYFILNVVRRVIGNSIVLTWGFKDNYIAAKTFNFGTHSGSEALQNDGNVFRSDFAEVEAPSGGVSNPNDPDLKTKLFYPPALHNAFGNFGGVPLNAFTYCNQDGNFENIEVAFLTRVDSVTETGEEITKQNYWDNVKMPIDANINLETPIFSIEAKICKDNKEIITNSLQIEYVNLSNKIHVYDYFLRLNSMVTNEAIQTLQLYTSDSTSIPPTPVTPQLYTLTIDDTTNDYSANISISFQSGVKKQYVWICSGSTPLVRLNGITSFHINLLRKRDKEGLS